MPLDIDGQTRPQGTAYDIGADEILVPAVLLNVGPQPLGIRATVQLQSRRAAILTTRFIPGSRALKTLPSRCSDCRVTLTVKRGHRVRNVRLAYHSGRYSAALTHLAAGTYKVRVTVTSRRLHLTYRSKWRTVAVAEPTTKHGKGTR